MTKKTNSRNSVILMLHDTVENVTKKIRKELILSNREEWNEKSIKIIEMLRHLSNIANRINNISMRNNLDNLSKNHNSSEKLISYKDLTPNQIFMLKRMIKLYEDHHSSQDVPSPDG